MMQKTWTPPVRIVFGAATLLGIFSTVQAYRLTTLNINDKMDIEVWRLMVLNLAYWYVPAALIGAIVRLQVRDNGFELSSAARAGQDHGVGLSNTRDRLECLYGASQSLDLIESGDGLMVQIHLPFHSVSAASDESSVRVA